MGRLSLIAARGLSWRAYQIFAVIFAVAIFVSTPARAETPDEQYEFASGLYNQKLYSVAAKNLRAFIAANPTHPKAALAAYQLGAALYRSTGDKERPDYTAVAAAYEKALLKPAPTPQIAAAARFELGDANFNLKRYDAAIKVLGEYLKSTPAPEKENAAWAQYWIAQSYTELKKPAEAKAAYQKVVTLYGDNAEVAPYAQQTLGILAANAGDNKAAAAAFDALLKRFPQSEVATETRLLLADSLLADKKFAEAQAAYRALINDPKAVEYKSDALLGLADASFGAKDFENAATQYEQVLALLKPDAPGRTTAQLLLANSYYNAKKYDEAVKAYAPLLQNGDANTAATANYFSAGSLLALNRPADAAPLYRKVVESYPTHALASKAALRLADAYADSKDNERALAAYKTVVAKYPQSAEAKEAALAVKDLEGAAANAQLLAIQAAYDVKNWTQTSQLAQAFLAKKPTGAASESAMYLLADAKRQAGDEAGAAQAFRAQIAAHPKGVLLNDARLGLTWALLDAKDFTNAEAAARAGLASAATDPKAAELRDRLNLALGESLLGGKKAGDAATVFARAESSTNKELAAQASYGAALAAELARQWTVAAAKWGKYAEAATDADVKAKAFLRQGLALRDSKNAAGALAAFDRAIAANPKGEVAAQALYESAWQAHDLKKADDEAARWTRLTTEFPESTYAGDAFFQQAEGLFKEKSYADAAAAYRRVVEKFPQSESASLAAYKLASALYNLENWSEAALAFDKAASAKKDFSLESSFWAGESLRKAGKAIESKARYDAFLKGLSTLPATSAQKKELDVFTPRARLGLGLSLAAANDWPGAVAAYKAGLNDAGGATAAELNFRLGQALMQQNNWKEAATQFLKVTIGFPQSEWADEAQWSAAQAMEKSGEKENALALYKQIAERQPASNWTKQAQERVTALSVN